MHMIYAYVQVCMRTHDICVYIYIYIYTYQLNIFLPVLGCPRVAAAPRVRLGQASLLSSGATPLYPRRERGRRRRAIIVRRVKTAPVARDGVGADTEPSFGRPLCGRASVLPRTDEASPLLNLVLAARIARPPLAHRRNRFGTLAHRARPPRRLLKLPKEPQNGRYRLGASQEGHARLPSAATAGFGLAYTR